MLAGGTSPGSINTIGSSAKVVLGGVDPQFPQLSSALNVNGIFGVQDQQVYNLATLNMGAGGILEFGLEGIDEGGTLTTGIKVGGSVSFNNTQIDLLDLGGLGVGTYRIMEFVSATGFATLGDNPGGFNFQLIQGSNFLELNVVELPEPGTGLILLVGLCGLASRRRKRRS